jgi:nucleotide-binding universal stress UspA family protein
MLNIARIVCPTDFSDASGHALEHAVTIAGYFEAALTVLHASGGVFIPITGVGMPAYAGEAAALTDRDRDELRQAAEAFAAPARAAHLEVEVLIAPGQPAPQILAACQSRRADLLVMGTHGSSGFEHLILGSVTEKVLRKAPCPVLTVPPRAEAAAVVPFKHILCAVDFSASSLKALTAALGFAKEADAELTILHVLDWPIQTAPPAALAGTGDPDIGLPVFDLDAYRQVLEQDASRRLSALVPADAGDWCTVTTLVRHGKPHNMVLEVAGDRGIDLLVLGVHGRSALDVILFGSTTNQVVRGATCPVLTVRS